ncbi:Transforming growth factor beta regulator 1 [Holothuria leucospilota]|uniref:Transforming growth factor beta regulator 1 n=1 Tax=Holothuria leucospilota TaxID=206669 RepID=A0A9Q0YG09_HOLLE|nr:Transforming growth factor beta regulator 1 [Holothuria leucospilota]
MADGANSYHPPATTMSVVPPSTISPQTMTAQPPPSYHPPATTMSAVPPSTLSPQTMNAQHPPSYHPPTTSMSVVSPSTLSPQTMNNQPPLPYHPPKTTMSVVPPSTLSPQTMNVQPPPSSSECFVQALGHDYNAIPVSAHFPRDVSPRTTTTHPPFPMPPLSLLSNNMPGVRLGTFPSVPAGMMELRSPQMNHQPPNFMQTHPNFQIPFQALSPNMVPLESPSPTALSQGFMYNSVPTFSPPFHQTSNVNMSHRKAPEVKDKPGVGWLDAAQKVLEASSVPLHIDEIKKRISERDLLRSNTRSTLEAALHKDIQRGSKRFRKVKDKVYRLVTPEELTAQVKKQIEMNSSRHNASSSSSQLVVGQSEQTNKKQRCKKNYLYLKRVVKQLVFENAALADCLAQTEQKLTRAKTERRFLLNRLLCYMGMTRDMSLLEVKSRKTEKEVDRRPDNKKRKDHRNKHRHKRTKRLKVMCNTMIHADERILKIPASGAMEQEETEIPKKKATVMTTKHYMLPIPLQPSGDPIFPIELSNLTVQSLGVIKFDRPKYHDKNHIYPPGYTSQRLYAHYSDPSVSMWYTCKILDGGLTPLFEIHCGDGGNQKFTGETINTCHQRLMEAVNKASGKRLVDDTRGSGAEFFGISNPTICNLIQNQPDADKCHSYKRMQFETCPEKDRKKLRSWCAEDPRIDYNALQRSREGFQRRLEFDGPSARLTFNTMTDSDRLRVFLNRTNASQLQPLTSSMSSLDDLSTNDGDADNSDHIDVT